MYPNCFSNGFKIDRTRPQLVRSDDPITSLMPPVWKYPGPVSLIPVAEYFEYALDSAWIGRCRFAINANLTSPLKIT